MGRCGIAADRRGDTEKHHTVRRRLLDGWVAARPWFTAYGLLVVIASIAAVRGDLLTLSSPLRCR